VVCILGKYRQKSLFLAELWESKAREVYKENVNDVHTYCEELGTEHGISIDLQFGNNGFEFVVRKEEMEGRTFPSVFINGVSLVHIVDAWFQSLLLITGIGKEGEQDDLFVSRTGAWRKGNITPGAALMSRYRLRKKEIGASRNR
jgi:hypothetical protein